VNVDLQEIAAAHDDLVATWQLRARGWTEEAIRHRLRRHGARRIHRGVYALTQSPLSRQQEWRAATLTGPSSFLSHASAGDCFGFRPWQGAFETITRPGSGGPKRFGDVLVLRSKTLDGETTTRNDIPITTAERALVDLAAGLPDKQKGRSMREALRLKTTTIAKLEAALERHAHRPGVPFLTALVARYRTLPYHRTRSDPEARALEVLHDAGIEIPLVNARIAGAEADLTWMRTRRIVEIDGPQYHRFKDENARKTAIWRNAGFDVKRIPSDAIYDEPQRLIALAT
jgi:hypothetical protein